MVHLWCSLYLFKDVWGRYRKNRGRAFIALTSNYHFNWEIFSVSAFTVYIIWLMSEYGVRIHEKQGIIGLVVSWDNELISSAADSHRGATVPASLGSTHRLWLGSWCIWWRTWGWAAPSRRPRGAASGASSLRSSAPGHGQTPVTPPLPPGKHGVL